MVEFCTTLKNAKLGLKHFCALCLIYKSSFVKSMFRSTILQNRYTQPIFGHFSQDFGPGPDLDPSLESGGPGAHTQTKIVWLRLIVSISRHFSKMFGEKVIRTFFWGGTHASPIIFRPDFHPWTGSGPTGCIGVCADYVQKKNFVAVA